MSRRGMCHYVPGGRGLEPGHARSAYVTPCRHISCCPLYRTVQGRQSGKTNLSAHTVFATPHPSISASFLKT